MYAYHELEEGADEVDGVGGADGVGEEAAEEGEQEGRAHEVGHRRRRLRRRVVHGPHQVRHQVARVRQERQVLKHLRNCMQQRVRLIMAHLVPHKISASVCRRANPCSNGMVRLLVFAKLTKMGLKLLCRRSFGILCC